MSKAHARLSVWILLVALLLYGCKSAPPPPPQTVKPDTAYTAAAQTIIAQLTEVAYPGTPTPTTLAGKASPVPGEASPTLPGPSETPALTSTPGPTDTPIPTPTPTVTEAPTVTTIPSDPRLSLGDPTLRDTFKDTANWPIFEDEHVKMALKDGNLQMTALNADKWDSWMLSWPLLKNFYLEVTAQPGTCKGLDRYGLLARSPDEEHAYVYAFTCDGQYSLRKWNGKRYIDLVDWTADENILAGAGKINRLGLMAEDNHLTLYANGHQINEVVDSSYKTGAFGLFVGSSNTTNFKVEMIEVDYWELP
jgi:hypothetical protein